jgi:hypothetical protein
MKSDFRYVVKESLREAFYPKMDVNHSYPLLKLVINGETFLGIISKNTTPNEREFQLKFFKTDKETGQSVPSPAKPWDLDKLEVNTIFKSKKLPDRLSKSFKGIPSPKIVNEELFLLEESSREVERWMENKSSA